MPTVRKWLRRQQRTFLGMACKASVHGSKKTKFVDPPTRGDFLAKVLLYQLYFNLARLYSSRRLHSLALPVDKPAGRAARSS